MDKITIERQMLLPCPFCGDDGDKGRQEVTQMIEGRNKFARITCRACGAMCPEENWNRRAALAQKAEPDEQEVALQKIADFGQDQNPVAWRHSNTGQLYDAEEEVPLADGDEWAEPLYATPATQQAPEAWRQWSTKLHDWDYSTNRDDLRSDTPADPLFVAAAQPAPAAVPLTDEKIDHTLATTLDEFARTTRGMSHALDVNADITANSRLRRMFARAVLAAGDKP